MNMVLITFVTSIYLRLSNMCRSMKPLELDMRKDSTEDNQIFRNNLPYSDPALTRITAIQVILVRLPFSFSLSFEYRILEFD